MDNVTLVSTVLLAILAIGTVTGFVKGFLGQVLELAGVVFAFVLAVLLGGAFAAFLEDRYSIPYSPALVISFIVIVVSTLIATHLAARAIQGAVRMTILGWVDRLSGAALGLVMGMIIASLLITVTLELPVPKSLRRSLETSSVSLFLKPVAGQIFNLIAAHGPKGIHYEEIFKKSDSV